MNFLSLFSSHLLGIITKKDILLHMKECEDMHGRSSEADTSATSHHSGSFFA